jgi:hypothetical protein
VVPATLRFFTEMKPWLNETIATPCVPLAQGRFHSAGPADDVAENALAFDNTFVVRALLYAGAADREAEAYLDAARTS